MHFHDFDLELPALGPARVHAQQDVGPVLALGAAGAGVDLEVGVVAVGLAGQQRLDLGRACVLQRLLQGRFGLLHDLGVAFGLAHLDEFGVVADRGLELAHGGDLGVQLIALLHDRARLLGVGPEVRILGAGVEIV